MRNERFLEERKGAASGDSVTSGGVGGWGRSAEGPFDIFSHRLFQFRAEVE